MEIKNYPWYPVPTVSAPGIKMGEGVDRDRDPEQGGHSQGRPGKEKENPFTRRRMTEEEFAEALEKLISLKGYKSANLSYRVEETAGERRVVLVLDPQQNVIRRITEVELGEAFLLRDEKTNEKGGLINKTV